jgi:hypothetical protein
MEDDSGDQPIDHLLLGGTPDEQARAAETILTEQATPELLALIFHSFPEGERAVRAWGLLADRTLDVDLLTNVLKQVTEAAVAEAAFARLEALEPSEGDVQHVMVFTQVQAIKNRAAERLLARGLKKLDGLSYVLAECDVPEHRDEAARRLLPRAKTGDHLSAIVMHATDRELVDAAWARLAKLRFGPKDKWNRVYLRDVICLHRDAERRELALELALAKDVVFDRRDAKMIREHVEDPRAKKIVA